MGSRFYNCVKRRRGLMGRAVAVVQTMHLEAGRPRGHGAARGRRDRGLSATAAEEACPTSRTRRGRGMRRRPRSASFRMRTGIGPAFGGVAWRVAAAADGPLALRQVGVFGALYALAAGSIVAVDMVTGERLAQAELPAPTPSRSAMLFIDSALAVPCADGSVALYTEDLERIAVSAVDPWGAAGDGAAVATDGAVLYAACPSRAGRVRVAGFSAYDAQAALVRGLRRGARRRLLRPWSRCPGAFWSPTGVLSCGCFPPMTARKLSSFDAGCAVGARVAPVYGGHDDGAEEPAPRFADAVLVGTEAGRVSLLRDRGAWRRTRASTWAARGRIARRLRPPAGGAWAADGGFIALDMRLSGAAPCPRHGRGGAGCGSGSVVWRRGVPRLDASTAEVTVYAAAEDGLRAVERSADGGLSVRTVCDAATIGGAPTSGATIAPLVDRDGTLVLVGVSGRYRGARGRRVPRRRDGCGRTRGPRYRRALPCRRRAPETAQG